ncbi:hypothetical protein KSS87_005112 [Heliosperma pusillum]|nr:hypothetical protein KSS87_005112 [Heliosperma pusillum]
MRKQTKNEVRITKQQASLAYHISLLVYPTIFNSIFS